MAVNKVSRVVLVVVLCYVQTLAQTPTDYKEPIVTIQALQPKGIRIFIPDMPGLSMFIFQGNINKDISADGVGSISAEIIAAKDGRWLYQDLTTQLKPKDIIYYYTYIVHNRIGRVKDKQIYVVEELVDPNSAAEVVVVGDCPPTITVVRDIKACAGRIIFEDNFDSLREDLWRFEQYIPDEPDFAFVSYQRPPNAPTISVRDGNLRIEPRLQQNLPSYSAQTVSTGSLDLYSGCTSSSTRCSMQSWGASILPPIVSGRMTTKSFAFTYGTVEIRAKLPQGDWLYPDILLQSFYEKYGSLNYGSGVVRIAGARGNMELKGGNTEYGNKVLYGGAILNADCHKKLLSRKVGTEGWGNDFHVYSVRWTPERITFFVDNEEWARVEPAASGFQGLFPSECKLPRSMLGTGSKIAPFDDFFGITLGVAAGGVMEFDDNLISTQGAPKPWKNVARKASLYFWQDIFSWSPTWRDPALIVDYVRVRAL